MNVSWEKSGVQIFLLWHPLSLSSTPRKILISLFSPLFPLCVLLKSKKLSQNLFAQVTRQIASHIPNSFSTQCVKMTPKSLILITWVRFISAVCLICFSYLFTFNNTSAVCLHIWFWYQLLVYICHTDISYLFTFVILISDVYLHLQCQFQLLVYKSNTKYQHHFWRENWKSQEIPFRNENSNETLFVHF